MRHPSVPCAPLERIGFWKAQFADDYPFPMELPTLGQTEVEPIARYLETGTVAEQWRGLSWCRYGCEGHFGSRDLSDGVWLWPEGLAHYVREHHIALPPAFLAHAAQGLAAPRLDPASLNDASQSDAVWVTWSGSFRTPQLTDRLRLAELEATQRCDRVIAGRASELSLGRGLSQTLCLSDGCCRPALAGMAICAMCVAEESRLMEHHQLECVLLVQLAAELRTGQSPT